GPDVARTQRNRAVAKVVLEAAWELVDSILDRPSEKLVTYGTLRPGEANQDLVRVDGSWAHVLVRGYLGELDGLPVLAPDPNGDEVPAEVMLSIDLSNAWDDLDRAEGAKYQRALIWFDGDNPGVGNSYVLADQ
ncbi:MAG: gamma-glutamylcyclotransferase, partial [Jiangellaceae bacterium]